MRQNIEEIFLRLIRLYTFNTPVKRGKYRLYQTALALCKERHEALPVRMPDGRRFLANLSDGMQETVYFLGEYERELSNITGRLIRKGHVCLDIGANFGWYTSLMVLACGASGQVHAFEPLPASFAELEKTYKLLGSPSNVLLNNMALGDNRGTIELHLFDGLKSGHASIAPREDMHSAVFRCKMIPLDDYLEENSIVEVDFIKVDIEGAELMFLKGAERLFLQASPPIFMIEMALATSKYFGYVPNDLIEFLRTQCDYQFYAADEYRGTLRLIDRFADEDIGANVFCVPRQRADENRSVISEYVED
jgi:FkbM family methyltransferase